MSEFKDRDFNARNSINTPECIVPDYVRDNYEDFMDWCSIHGISDIGHAVVPMMSTKLRAKPVNIDEFDKKCFKNGSELDGSSFATGGGRVIHKSMVEAHPDKEGLWFMLPDELRRGTLYIMSDMGSPEGNPMCARKPLSNALKLLNPTLEQLFKEVELKLPENNEKFALTVGYEKEFFIIPKEVEAKREDLKYIGQTVIGSPGPINQNLHGVYLTIPKRKEEALFDDIVRDLGKVGIIAVQKHMEVGQTGNALNGRQCEVVFKYKEAMAATDSDIISRQIIEDVCDRHGYRALISSKPFTDDSSGVGINGSGKHTNMSISLYNYKRREIVENLFENPKFKPEGAKEQVNLIGLAVLSGMGRHWQILDSSVASRGNDLRRRPGFEAPVYLSASIGTASEFRDTPQNDRNRSVSIGLSENKIEWRVPGANTPMHYPLAFLTMAFIEVLNEVIEALKQGKAAGKPIDEIIAAEYKRLRDEVNYFVVNEDVYELSIEEAEKRFGYKAPANTPQAVMVLDDAEKIKFLEYESIFTEEMIRAFKMMQLENYNKRVIAEAKILAEMAKRISNKVFKSDIMQRYSRELFDVDPRLKQRQDFVGQITAALLALIDSSYLESDYQPKEPDLKQILQSLDSKSIEECSKTITDLLLPHMAKIRKYCEQIVDIIGGEADNL